MSYLMFKTLSHFELIFVCDERVYSNFTDLHKALPRSQHHLRVSPIVLRLNKIALYGNTTFYLSSHLSMGIGLFSPFVFS